MAFKSIGNDAWLWCDGADRVVSRGRTACLLYLKQTIQVSARIASSSALSRRFCFCWGIRATPSFCEICGCTYFGDAAWSTMPSSISHDAVSFAVVELAWERIPAPDSAPVCPGIACVRSAQALLFSARRRHDGYGTHQCSRSSSPIRNRIGSRTNTRFVAIATDSAKDSGSTA